jgi:hypothetical protein
VSLQLPRRTLAEIVGVLALCGGVYYFTVVPAQANLAGIRQQLQASTSRSVGAGAQAPVDLRVVQESLDRVARRTALIDMRSRAASDETTAFAMVSALARSHGIEINHLQPTKVATSAAPAPAPAAAPAPGAAAQPAGAGPVPAPPEPQLDCTLTVAGSYTSFIRFADALANSIGFASIRSLQVSPDTSAPDRVTANISVRFFGFHTTTVKSILRPAPDAASASGAGATPPVNGPSTTTAGVPTP